MLSIRLDTYERDCHVYRVSGWTGMNEIVMYAEHQVGQV